MRNILFFTLVFIALTARSILAQSYDPVYEVGKNDCKPVVPEWQILAEQGNVDAQFNIGNLHRMGVCFPENGPEAIRWFRMAANQGDAQAQYNLGLMYHRGDGVPQNLAQAFIWYSMAQINGVDHAERNRIIAQEEMNETQISIAMQKAVDCLHSDYQNCE